MLFISWIQNLITYKHTALMPFAENDVSWFFSTLPLFNILFTKSSQTQKTKLTQSKLDLFYLYRPFSGFTKDIANEIKKLWKGSQVCVFMFTNLVYIAVCITGKETHD